MRFSNAALDDLVTSDFIQGPFSSALGNTVIAPGAPKIIDTESSINLATENGKILITES